MKNGNRLKILIIFIASSFLISCAKKGNNNIDFDFSTLKKTSKIGIADPVLKDPGIKNKDKIDNKLFIKDLMPLKDIDQVVSKTKFGKKDPFSKGGIQSNKLTSDFQLTGFLNTKNDKYIFVNYLGNEGTIKEGSIGGINTNLLPNGAKVINIDSKKMNLTINFENEDFIFKL